MKIGLFAVFRSRIKLRPQVLEFLQGLDEALAALHGDLVKGHGRAIWGLDIAVDDLPPVEIGEAAEDLPGQIGEGLLVPDVLALQRPAVHVLEQDLDLAVVVEQVVALDDVGFIDVAQDFDLAADLVEGFDLVVAVNHLERVKTARGAVDDLVDGGIYKIQEFKLRQLEKHSREFFFSKTIVAQIALEQQLEAIELVGNSSTEPVGVDVELCEIREQPELLRQIPSNVAAASRCLWSAFYCCWLSKGVD
ncbi:hypothetical protein TB1_035282 [Malus domestica]